MTTTARDCRPRAGHGGFWNANGVGAGQAEAVRVPLADGTLVTAPVEEDSPLIPSLLTLSDVYGTGYHAAIRASVGPRTSVTVIGDGAVGLIAVLSAPLSRPHLTAGSPQAGAR